MLIQYWEKKKKKNHIPKMNSTDENRTCWVNFRKIDQKNNRGWGGEPLVQDGQNQRFHGDKTVYSHLTPMAVQLGRKLW